MSRKEQFDITGIDCSTPAVRLGGIKSTIRVPLEDIDDLKQDFDNALK